MLEEINLVLPCGASVKESFFNSMLRDILDATDANAFMVGVPYSAEDLIDPNDWRPGDKAGHILIGKCVAHMARTGLIPFSIQGCAHNHRYLLMI